MSRNGTLKTPKRCSAHFIHQWNFAWAKRGHVPPTYGMSMLETTIPTSGNRPWKPTSTPNRPRPNTPNYKGMFSSPYRLPLSPLSVPQRHNLIHGVAKYRFIVTTAAVSNIYFSKNWFYQFIFSYSIYYLSIIWTEYSLKWIVHRCFLLFLFFHSMLIYMHLYFIFLQFLTWMELYKTWIHSGTRLSHNNKKEELVSLYGLAH